MTELASLDLPETQWLDLSIAGSSPAVRLARLGSDPMTRASVSLVRFPPGWRRPGSGHYLPAEEFVVLEGSIDVVGSHGPGDYVYLPPRTDRTDSVSTSGALVIAWFSGFPEWVPGAAAAEPATAPVTVSAADVAGVLRADAPEVAGEYAVLRDAAGRDPLPVDADVLDPAARAWAWVPAGTPLPAGTGPLHVRTWA
ncbi:hypothetical protein [Nocardioides pantholopis]|uniref:hypothetical protein n=1 Tax=Nocardioides pantholopis TaxID=2483798 RepID=UPI000FD8028F|nr:hypothetical protein [Nocardioides pantholopis]